MPDNRLTTLNAVHLSETTKDWAEALNDNFAELDERKTDIGDTSTLVHDGSYVHTDNNFTDAYKAKLDEAEQNVQSDWNQSDSTADDYIKNKPTLGTAAAKDFTTSVTQNSGDLVTSGAVFSAIDNLPEPMVFKGTLGTGGMSAFSVGDTFANGDKIHFDTTKGDELAAYLEGLTYSGSGWEYSTIMEIVNLPFFRGARILSSVSGMPNDIYMLIIGEEFSASNYLWSSEDIAEAGISAGFNNTLLDENGDYTITFESPYTISTINDTTPPTWNGIIIGKGGGASATISELPQPSSANEGFTYKVITDGTYASQAAKVGDVFVSNGSAWVLIPSGDDVEDTWRAINVNGTQLKGNGITSGAINFKNGGNVTVTGSGDDITLGVASGYSIPSTTQQTAWTNKQDALDAQTAYTAKGTSTKVPTITTNALGQVTSITETDIAFPVTSVNGSTGAITGLATETYVDNAIAAVDQKTILDFTATGWTEGSDGYYTKSIATTKYPINCFNSNNKVVMATLGVTKSGTAVTAITIESDEPFAGYVVAL